MNQEIKNEILSAIEKMNQKVDSIQEQVAKIPEIQKEVAKIPEMQKEVAKIPEMQKEIAKIPEMQKEIAKISEMQRELAKIGEVQKQIIQLQKDTRDISRSVAVIEHEHGDKLNVLFDAFIINRQKIEKQEEIFKFYEKKIQDHDTAIDFLQTKVQGI